MKRQIASTPRLLLGALFLVFGLNSFYAFMAPPTVPPEAIRFWIGVGSTGYLFKLLKITEVLCGLSLVLNRYTNLSTVVLAPIVINIIAYHAFLDPGNAVTALVVGSLYAHLLFSKRRELKVLLKRN
jgi:uncharacterized membrane protein YphA (DoxX/SURF4 family)